MSHASDSAPADGAPQRTAPRDAADAPPPFTDAETKPIRRLGRFLGLLNALPDTPLDAVLRRDQKPTYPPRKAVDRRLVSRERVAHWDAEHPGIPVTWIDRPRASRAAIVHLHGGAYATGEAEGHWRWLEELRRRSGAAAAMVHYRMPPTSPFPAALDDAVAAIAALVTKGVLREGTWVLSGDSAGGGLALAALAQLREQGIAAPAGVLLQSPWTDLTLTDPLVERNEKRDVLLRRSYLARCARRYAGRYALDDPRLSPRFAEAAQLPPVLLFSAEEDILLGDSRALAAQLQGTGTPLVHIEQERGQHDYAIFGDGPAAQWAMRRQIAFVREACGLRA